MRSHGYFEEIITYLAMYKVHVIVRVYVMFDKLQSSYICAVDLDIHKKKEY